MSFTSDQIGFVDILPGINIARVGDSDACFDGPEVPGVDPIPDGGFKDSEHKIKKQTARFRVYAYDKSSNLLGEIDGLDYSLRWTVHVANKKAAWVNFRGRYDQESWNLRNPKVQGWSEGQEKTYDYTDSRNKLIVDSEECSIEGVGTTGVMLKGQFTGSLSDQDAVPVNLGELRTDDRGRLIVLAGTGEAFSVIPPKDRNLENGFNNSNWVDTMCDGTVCVTVKSKTGDDIPVKNQATIITAPPRFASGIHCPTTLLDLVEDIYEGSRRAVQGKDYDVGEVNYYRHIYPIFNRIYGISWTNKRSANAGHGVVKASKWNAASLSRPDGNRAARTKIFQRVRVPVIEGDKANEKRRDEQATKKYMPWLAGDAGDCSSEESDEDEGSTLDNEPPAANNRLRWASLTQLQYGRLKKWEEGKFVTGEQEVPPGSFDEIPLSEQPHALTRAALEWSVGAALYPGIEVFWAAQLPENYQLDELDITDRQKDNYRFAKTVKPGDLGKGLCLPWQSDFYFCRQHWWPSVRPDEVVTEATFEQMRNTVQPEELAESLQAHDRKKWAEGIGSNSEMVRKWNQLGFVAQQQYGTDDPRQLKIYIERERNMPRSASS
ncbi:hypothetical protein FRC12_002512 [Ceratobasidium sp. 428]|nr:hypothetical protein FRC09_001933 [Ceratobasidium sp. 395]KAG8773484.1 hypothetical protein FRC12_002512 [Ceratobasidium sp. 428]